MMTPHSSTGYMRRIMTCLSQRIFLVRSVILALLSAAALFTAPFKTRHVVILIMDGARYTETWGDAMHTNVPKIAALAAQGVVLTNFYTTLSGSAALDWTETNPGHARIMTGTVQNIANDGSQLPSMPSMFQEYRKQTGNASNTAWVITSKDKLVVLANSSAAGWNSVWQPAYNCGVNGNGTGGYRNDSSTHIVVKQKLTNDRPALMIINYRGPDSMGHANNWDGYIAAIREVDGYADDLWNTIQSDAALKDTTALIVLNDHGRHTNPVYWYGHGNCHCEGCSHIMFVALGPDFKQHAVFGPVRREQIDIAPTVAMLIGFSVTNSPGSFITEIVTEASVTNGVPAGPATNIPVQITSAEKNDVSRAAAVHNPCRDCGNMVFINIPDDTHFAIYSISGHLVRRFSDAASGGNLIWDMCDGSGRKVPPGVYICHLVSGTSTKVIKVIVQK